MGTEVEVQFGNSLQAAMARKLRESDIATQWTLNYQLNSKLRMQFTVASVPPYPRTLIFQYSEDSGWWLYFPFACRVNFGWSLFVSLHKRLQGLVECLTWLSFDFYCRRTDANLQSCLESWQYPVIFMHIEMIWISGLQQMHFQDKDCIPISLKAILTTSIKQQ